MRLVLVKLKRRKTLGNKIIFVVVEMNILFRYQPQKKQFNNFKQLPISGKYYIYAQCLREENLFFVVFKA